MLGVSNTVRLPGKTEHRKDSAGEAAGRAPSFGPQPGTPLLSRPSSPNTQPGRCLPLILRFREPRATCQRPSARLIPHLLLCMGSPHWEASWPEIRADSPAAAEWMQRAIVLALNHVLGQPMLSTHSGQGTDTAQEAGVQATRWLSESP